MPGGHGPPIVETCQKIVNVVGNCQSCRRRGEGWRFKMLLSKKYLVCRENFSICCKSTALGPPKNMGPTAPLVQCPFLIPHEHPTTATIPTNNKYLPIVVLYNSQSKQNIIYKILPALFSVSLQLLSQLREGANPNTCESPWLIALIKRIFCE